MNSVRDAEFEAFVRQHRTSLVRAATNLTVGDRHAAEDVVQRSLIKLYLAWPRVRTMNVDAYARRVVVNTFMDERRRPFARRERTVAEVPDHSVESDRWDGLDAELVNALRTLPRGMRSIVVLRYVEDLSVDETADVANCTTGNVKSQAARGLAKLRAELDPTPSDTTPIKEHRHA
jgi:RNA polymerase sigma-70 factor (sigma-E family)